MLTGVVLSNRGHPNIENTVLLSGNVQLFISTEQAPCRAAASWFPSMPQDPHRSERGRQTFPFQRLARPVAGGDQGRPRIRFVSASKSNFTNATLLRFSSQVVMATGELK